MIENPTEHIQKKSTPLPAPSESKTPVERPPVDLECCPLCSSRDRSHYTVRGNLRLARCQKCDMVWDDQAPVDPKKLYDQNYYQGGDDKIGYTNYFSDMSLNRATFRDRLKRSEQKLGKKGNLLDVGCALGDCLLEAKKLGWLNPQGLEVSKYAAQIARERGLEVFHGDLASRLPEEGSFDVILMQDVIEHTVDPIYQMKRALSLLKPGGWALLITPNVAGRSAHYLKGQWYHYKKGEHLTYFSPDTLTSTLEKAGFTDIEIAPTSHHLSFGYIIDRLKGYAPWFFAPLGKLLRFTKLEHRFIWLRTGEIEAWAMRPLLSALPV